MSDDVYNMQPREIVRIDLDKVVEVYETMSDPGQEDHVMHAVETLSAQIDMIGQCYMDARFCDVQKLARRLIPVAEELGLVGVRDAARGVQTCAGRRDGPALAATIARLVRIGDRSIGALTDPQSLPC